MRGEWRSVWTMCGALSVMTYGVVMMPLWCVDSWTTLLTVRMWFPFFILFYVWRYLHLFVWIDAVAYGNAHFGAGVGLIYLNNVGCTGAETSLLQCSYTTASSCTYAHSEDAGVRCQGDWVYIASEEEAHKLVHSEDSPWSRIVNINYKECSINLGALGLHLSWKHPSSQSASNDSPHRLNVKVAGSMMADHKQKFWPLDNFSFVENPLHPPWL